MENRDIEEIILEIKRQREEEKINRANALKESQKLVDAASKLNDAAEAQAELNKTNAEAELIKSQAEVKKKSAEATKEKIFAEAELARAKAEKINRQADAESAKNSARLQREKNQELRLQQEIDKAEEKRILNFVESMTQVRESLKGSVSTLLDSLSNSVKFDIRQKPITGAVAVGSLAANAVATQDRIPPIYGILTKAAGALLTATSFYAGRGIERLLGKRNNEEAKTLIKLDPVLKQVAATNKQLALEMARFKIDKFNTTIKEKFEKEKAEFNNKFEVLKQSNVKQKEVVFENKTPNKFESLDNSNVVNRLDEIISIVKNIHNQFDPEEEREKYNEEIAFRNQIISILTEKKKESGKTPPENQNGFSLLEVAGLAGISTMVSNTLKSIAAFMIPMKALGAGLLRFAPGIGLVGSLVLSLDWEKDILKPIENIKEAFDNGDFFEGAARLISMPSDIISKFVLRTGAFITDLFNFEDVSNKLNSLADNANIYNSLLNLKSTLFQWIQNIVKDVMLFSENFSIKEIIESSVIELQNYFKNLDILGSIKYIFDFIHDKIESLKFWKIEKNFLLPENKKPDNTSLIPQSNTKEILSENQTIIKNQERVFNTANSQISKTSDTISKNLSEKIILRTQEQKKATEALVEKLVTQTQQIIAPITNTQLNVNNNTAVASRPLARIPEYSANRATMTNTNADFSGYVIG